jgi:hypothetical protein
VRYPLSASFPSIFECDFGNGSPVRDLCTDKTTRSFRNIYTYLDDCYSQDVEPSLPQLLLMLDSAEVSMAFAWGPDWLMRSVSYTFGVVVGRV